MTSGANGSQIHAYLGSMETVDHRQFFLYPDGKVLRLPLIYLPDIVLFPGDTLPLRLSVLSGIQDFLSSDDILLAVLASNQDWPQYGTTVRIERFSSVEDNEVRMTGTARQRFRLHQRLRSESDAHVLWGDVEMLPLERAPRIPFDDLYWQREIEHENQSRESKRRWQRLRARQFPAYWGRAIFAFYDARLLVQKIQNMLLSNIHGDWFRKPQRGQSNVHRDDDESLDKLCLVHFLALPSDEQDPTLFAFWVAGNLPLDTTQRLDLLKVNSTVQLLLREIELLKEVQEDIFCFRCGSFLASTREIFSMTARGVAGDTFVNPGGHVFQVLTLRDVNRANVLMAIVSSTNDSWFPGYAWSIAHCNLCYQHLGWRFDRVDSTRLPATFFGLRRAAVSRSRKLRPIDPRDLGLDGYDTDDYAESVPSSEGSSRSYSN